MKTLALSLIALGLAISDLRAGAPKGHYETDAELTARINRENAAHEALRYPGYSHHNHLTEAIEEANLQAFLAQLDTERAAEEQTAKLQEIVEQQKEILEAIEAQKQTKGDD